MPIESTDYLKFKKTFLILLFSYISSCGCVCLTDIFLFSGLLYDKKDFSPFNAVIYLKKCRKEFKKCIRWRQCCFVYLFRLRIFVYLRNFSSIKRTVCFIVFIHLFVYWACFNERIHWYRIYFAYICNQEMYASLNDFRKIERIFHIMLFLFIRLYIEENLPNIYNAWCRLNISKIR